MAETKTAAAPAAAKTAAPETAPDPKPEMTTLETDPNRLQSAAAEGPDFSMDERDHIAVHLAAGLLAGSPQMGNLPAELASRAYVLADAMIEHGKATA